MSSLTSMLKKVDAVYDYLKKAVGGGSSRHIIMTRRWCRYPPPAGMDDIVSADDYQAKFISGEITVPDAFGRSRHVR